MALTSLTHPMVLHHIHALAVADLMEGMPNSSMVDMVVNMGMNDVMP